MPLVTESDELKKMKWDHNKVLEFKNPGFEISISIGSNDEEWLKRLGSDMKKLLRDRHNEAVIASVSKGINRPPCGCG
jgi:hypothetical protein